jgi:transcriptional antiterminator RfaH
MNTADQLSWYVVHCQPQKEALAAFTLREYHRLTVYVPKLLHHSKGKTRWMLLFPRYIFVQIDLSLVPSSAINATPGVSRLVSFADKPQSIPDETIQSLQQAVQTLNHQQEAAQSELHAGDRVRIQHGPLYGLEAIFLGPTTPGKRVQILLEFMGRLHTLSVERDNLAPSLPTAATDHRSRRTRGRGRKIRKNLHKKW